MKRLFVVLGGLLVLPAFAEVAPLTYDSDLTFSDVEIDDADTDAASEENDVKTKTTTTKGTINSGRVSGRTTARTTTSRNTRTPSTRTSAVRSRGISVRNTTTPVKTTSVSARRTTTATTQPTAQRSGTTARAGVINSSTTLYNPNAVVQPRGTARASVGVRGAAIRAASPLTSTSVTPTPDSAAETTSELDTLKSLTEYCQAQYAACMDNYCNALDDNQGRCTCSKNLKNYEKTEAALEEATEALQDVARNIQYIGLPADQITTLFAETEAELEMKNSKDNSSIRSSLDKVKRMIIDVKGGSTTASETTGAMNFDLSGMLNFDMGDFGFDLGTFMNTTSNTNSISNQRGESLYKTATARCKASVLNSCTAQGVDAAVVTNSYDLEIDKSCLAYERALTESNQQMEQTVANAKEVLKKARLMVAQNKNAYDLRGCVSALESCVQDEFVCGGDYESCLDPTGQYIVNGSVVVGSMPGNNTESTSAVISSNYSHDNLFSTWEVEGKNPWHKDPSDTTKAISLAEYINKTVTSGAASDMSDNMSAFLQNKIGYHDDKTNKDYGMCMSVLNQCQDYTYDSKGKYRHDNDVIKNFLQRALVQIKVQQDELLATYATDCVSDVSSCLTTNNYDDANPDSTKSRTAINSCYAQIKTCMSVNGNVFGAISSNALKTWVTGTYASVETVADDNEIESVCNAITDSTEVNNVNVYCTEKSKVLTDVCQWDNTKGTKKGTGTLCK
ncbi:MAG: hypothetical protein KBT14_00085 [Proteobacteria bacterium]|nr:hypothetical protein [Candidatus Enterousia onthequi]